MAWVSRGISLLALALLGCDSEPGTAAPGSPAEDGAGGAQGGGPGGNEGGDGGGPGGALIERRLRLAPRVRAVIDTRAFFGGPIQAVGQSDGGVVIALQENTLIVDALRSAHGVISIDLVGRSEARYELVVEVLAGFSSAFGGRLHSVGLAPTTDDGGSESASEAWVRYGGAIYGSWLSKGVELPFELSDSGALALIPVPLGADTFAIRYREGEWFWGSSTSEGNRQAARFGGDFTVQVDPLPYPAEYYAVRGSTRVGTWWVDGTPTAFRCDGEGIDGCRSIGPVGASTSSARAVDADQRVFGCAQMDGVSRPFTTDATGSELLAFPERGCVSAVGPDGLLVGDLQTTAGEFEGFLLHSSGKKEAVRVGRAFGTQLMGASPAGLVGSARDESGSSRAAWIAPLESATGASYEWAPEVEDPGLAHACGHTTHGPFASIAASPDPTLAGVMLRTHTNYEVLLSTNSEEAFVFLRNLVPGRATLHLQRLSGIRLISPSGQRVRAAYFDETGRCAGLRGFAQFDLEEVGDYRLFIGERKLPTVEITYERTWIVQP